MLPGSLSQLARPLLAFTTIALPSLAVAQNNSVEELTTVRANLSQALEYADQAAKEQFAWEQRRQELEDLILLGQEERKNLESSIALARPILEELQARTEALDATEEETVALADLLNTACPSLAQSVLDSAKRWPELLLQEAREPLHELRTLLDQDSPTLNIEDQGKLVHASVQSLEAALLFQSKVHRSALLNTLPDGREALFDVVFIGLGGGYYLSQDLQLAGKIAMRDGQWKWVAQDELVSSIQAFIEILDEQRPATWIHLPVDAAKKGGAQ